MPKRTHSFRNTVFAAGILLLAVAIGLAGFGRIRIEPATAEATTGQNRLNEISHVIKGESPDHPDQAILSGIYEAATSSVVSILVRRQTGAAESAQPQGGQGSGWVWDDQGHIITNNHVVEGASEIVVNFANGMWTKAKLIARDPQSDLAVLRVDAPAGVSLRPLQRAPDLPKVGHYSLALGSPFGLDNSMTLGIVSALGRSFPMGVAGRDGRYSLPDVIQTDAAVNPGNSGGPLLNLKGQVVGINFAIRTDERSVAGRGVNSGVGFAIPVTVAEKIIPALIGSGEFQYPFMGIRGMTVSALVAEQYDLPDNSLGVYVSDLLPGGPAASSGLRRRDVIVSVDGEAVRNFEDLLSYLIMHKSPGETVEIGILRNRRSRAVDVKLATRPATEDRQQEQSLVNSSEAVGIAVVEIGNTIGQISRRFARSAVQDGVRVWVVTLVGAKGNATVVVDVSSGEVLGLEVDAD